MWALLNGSMGFPFAFRAIMTASKLEEADEAAPEKAAGGGRQLSLVTASGMEELDLKDGVSEAED